MNRVCVEKATGKLIEMQSGGKVDRLQREAFKDDARYQKYLTDCDSLEAARLDTLRQNAINAGYKEDEIIVKWVADEEWATIQAGLNQPTPEQIAEREREALIQAKIREQAISALTAEGKLTADGKAITEVAVK